MSIVFSSVFMGCDNSYIAQLFACAGVLKTENPGATLSRLRLGTNLGLLLKPFVASQFTLRNLVYSFPTIA